MPNVTALKNARDAFVNTHIAELEAYSNNPTLCSIVNQKLPNDSPPTDFADWGVCLVESVEAHRDVTDRWASSSVPRAAHRKPVPLEVAVLEHVAVPAHAPAVRVAAAEFRCAPQI